MCNMQTLNTHKHDPDIDEDLADVLTAISVVTKRLAQKLNILSREVQDDKEGDVQNEQDE